MKEHNQRYIDVVSELTPIIISALEDTIKESCLGGLTNIEYETSIQKDRQHPIIKLLFANTPTFPDAKIHRVVLYPIDMSPTNISTIYLPNQVYDLFLQWPQYPGRLSSGSIISLLDLQYTQTKCLHLVNVFFLLFDHLKIKKMEAEVRESGALYLTVYTLEKNTDEYKIHFSNCIITIKELNKTEEKEHGEITKG